MAEIVAGWRASGRLDPVEAEGEAADYYVVHPLLKHLALLSLETGDAD